MTRTENKSTAVELEKMEVREINKELRSLRLQSLQARSKRDTAQFTRIKERERQLTEELQRRRKEASDAELNGYTKSARFL